MGRTTFYMLEQEQKAVSHKGGREAREDAEKEEAEEVNTEEEDVDWEEQAEQYHNGSGWYELPGYDKAMRKDEAINALKEG